MTRNLESNFPLNFRFAGGHLNEDIIDRGFSYANIVHDILKVELYRIRSFDNGRPTDILRFHIKCEPFLKK